MRTWATLATSCATCVLFAHVADAAPTVEVTVGLLNVRNGPSISGTRLGSMSRGQLYPQLATSGNWVKLQFDGRQGWSYAPYTRTVDRPHHTVTATALNVRTGPSTGYRKLGTLPNRARVVVIGTSGSWRKLSYGGQTAWVHGDYLRAGAAAPTPTATATPTPMTHEVAVSRLNLRTGPSTGYRIVVTLVRADRGRSLELRGSWRKIATAKGTGWVYAPYLRAVGSNGQAVSSAGFINLPASGEGFYSYQAAYRRWATPTLVYGIQRACRRYAREAPGRPRLGTGDMSRERGGEFAPHVSHRYGTDLDARPMRNDGREAPVLHSDSTYSRALTERILSFLKAELPETLILFNDRRIPGVTWYRGHDNHFHFRIRR